MEEGGKKKRNEEMMVMMMMMMMISLVGQGDGKVAMYASQGVIIVVQFKVIQ